MTMLQGEPAKRTLFTQTAFFISADGSFQILHWVWMCGRQPPNWSIVAKAGIHKLLFCSTANVVDNSGT